MNPNPAGGDGRSFLAVDAARAAILGALSPIAGRERVAVRGLMGPGVDPHLYKPSAGDAIRLGNADIIFYGGLHLEGRMAELFEKIELTGKPAVAVSRVQP